MSPTRLITSLIFVALSAAQASAQSNNEVNAGIEFDFSLPGARSLALGGAFVAMADDATAAWANPAGLTILNQKEVSVEGRVWRFRNSVTAKGMAFGPPSGVGVDTIEGLQNNESSDWTGSPAYMSFVLPSNRWAIALYRHQLSNYESSVVSEGPFARTRDFTQDPVGEVDRVEPFTGDMRLTIADYGVGVGYRATDRLAIGATVALYDFSFISHNRRTSYVPLFPPAIATRTQFTDPGERFGPADFSDANVARILTQSGDDQTLGVNIGVLYRTDNWSVGGAYRQGPDFTFTSVYERGLAEAPVGTKVVPDKNVGFAAPDVYAVGATYRPSDRWVLTAEFDRVQYSQLSSNSVEVLGIVEGNAALGANITSNLRFPDANQLRVGTEYAITRGRDTILLRLGGWFDPEHRLRYEGNLERLQVLFRPGNHEFHLAPGFGFAAGRAQFDVAVDLSNRVNTLAISTVWRF
jgi:long-subunit fatty acid transport protein